MSWAEIVRWVHARANNCCEYCQTSQLVMGQAMHVEHINPTGGDQTDNLCLSCPSCNLSKARAISAIDPMTGDMFDLFNPRKQIWLEHFEWTENATVIHGITSTGRASVRRLKMNQPRLVQARGIWVLAGVHPPA